MNGNKEILNRAVDIIKQRRNRAKAINDLHFEEVNAKIPEIGEINSQLARTGMEILNVIKKGETVSQKIQIMKDKNFQAQQMVNMLLKQNGYPEDYLHIKYTCEKCNDTGFFENQRCSCIKNLVAQLSAKRMNAGSQIQLCSFETFQVNYYQGRTADETAQNREIMSKILQYCKRYSADFSLSSHNVLMFGKTGLGKTHLSLSIANEILKNGFNVLYDSTLNYLRKIEKEHFGRDSSNVDTLEMLLSSDLLILDDLGSEFDTPFYISTMYNIINTRMSRGLPTIISTNLSHEGIQKKYDDRIVSRLFAAYDCLEFVGIDIRLIKRKNGEM